MAEQYGNLHIMTLHKSKMLNLIDSRAFLRMNPFNVPFSWLKKHGRKQKQVFQHQGSLFIQSFTAVVEKKRFYEKLGFVVEDRENE